MITRLLFSAVIVIPFKEQYSNTVFTLEATGASRHMFCSYEIIASLGAASLVDKIFNYNNAFYCLLLCHFAPRPV